MENMKEFIKKYLMYLFALFGTFLLAYLVLPSSSHKENFDFNVIYVLSVLPIISITLERFIDWVDAGLLAKIVILVLLLIISIMAIFLSY